jgi:lysophospholipase
MRTSVDATYSPIEHCEWWDNHVVFSKFNRQGIDIMCASFVNTSHKCKGNIVFITGWSETFLKYPHLIKSLYEQGYSVYTYDHQSQGLSGRRLPEQQSTWVNSFEDYVDDFVFFVTNITRESTKLPIYLVAHSMGGLIASTAMSRLPTLINRAVLCAPMFRNKCGLKVFNYKNPLPQPIAYWLTFLSCKIGLGTMHALGFFKEKSSNELISTLNVATSCTKKLMNWQLLRQKYPQIMATCPTNDWVLQSFKAQNKFSTRHEFVKTNVCILSAGYDYFVYNRALTMFAQQAPACKIFVCEEGYHELLLDVDCVANASLKIIVEYFSQIQDDVNILQPTLPFINYDKSKPIYSIAETVIRASGMLLASVGIIAGVSMIFSGKRR